MTGRAPGVGRSVYGLDVSGLDDVAELDPGAHAGAGGSDLVRVRVTRRDGPHLLSHRLDSDRSVDPMGASHQWVLDRIAGAADLIGPPIDPDLLAHPCLAPVAIAFNRWAGRESFHAACFAVGGRAYGVIGPRTAGKSSLMAGLAHAGTTVLSDDVLITDGADVFAGPRCIDLRTPIPGVQLATASARLGTRYRLSLPSASPRMPLGGWIFLHWGPDVSMRPCPPTVVLGRLAAWRGRRVLPTDPSLLLDLAARPGWDLHRPADWRDFDRTLGMLTGAVQQSAGVPA